MVLTHQKHLPIFLVAPHKVHQWDYTFSILQGIEDCQGTWNW